MPESRIVSDNPAIMPNLNSCSSVLEIANTLKATKTGMGVGDCGIQDSTNFKNVVGASGVSNYDQACCKLLSFTNEAIAIEMVAVARANQDTNIAKKYIWISGNNRNHPCQSAWEKIQRV